MATRSAAKASPPSAAMDIEQAAQNGQKSLTAFAHMHTRVFRDAMRFNAQLLDFARRRVGADIETSDRLSRCETITDAMDVMTNFYNDAVQDYASQTADVVLASTEISARNVEESLAEASRLNGNE